MLTGLCAGMLRSPPARTKPLAELILRKTAGNPFFAQRFLRFMHQTGALRLRPRSQNLAVGSSQVAAAAVTENVAELMASAIARLPADTVQLVKVAACVPGSTRLGLLAAVAGQPDARRRRNLWMAVREGILIAERGDPADPPAYRFVHDRVGQQAPTQLQGALERRRHHLAIGRWLRDVLPRPADEPASTCSDQMNRGVALIADERENGWASRSGPPGGAAGAGAWRSLPLAIGYARLGIAALPPATRGSHRPLWLALYRRPPRPGCFSDQPPRARKS